MWVVAGIVVGLVLLALAVAVRTAVVFPIQPWRAPLPALDDGDRARGLRLEAHVRAVASAPHSTAFPAALEASAAYIERALEAFGYHPTAQVFETGGVSVRNIEVLLEPQDATARMPCYVIGAHYDAPDDCPGANDNGTGVAALLELASVLRTFQPVSHRVRLVFFVNEEQPWGMTPDMGSYRHAAALHASGERISGMFALETLGYFSDRPGSQRYPFPFGWVYPDRGNFVAFVGLPGARSLVGRAVSLFRRERAFPAIGGVAPAFVEGVALSDHWAYHQFGYRAAMITDTAPFRNPFYHQLSDTPDTVDYASLARITRGLDGLIRKLAG